MSSSTIPTPAGVQLLGEVTPAFAEILTPDALAFVAKLQRAFGGRREESLQRRQDRQAALDRGETLDFLPETPRNSGASALSMATPEFSAGS